VIKNGGKLDRQQDEKGNRRLASLGKLLGTERLTAPGGRE
jgi:hypothetical protein